MISLNELKSLFRIIDGNRLSEFKYHENDKIEFEDNKVYWISFLPFDKIENYTVLSVCYDNPGRDYGLYLFSDEKINNLQDEFLKWLARSLSDGKYPEYYKPNIDTIPPDILAQCILYERNILKNVNEYNDIFNNCEIYKELQNAINSYDLICDMTNTYIN